MFMSCLSGNLRLQACNLIDRCINASGRWIVRSDPEAGLEMFTGMQPPLAPEVALPILASEAPALCAPYLQAALASNTAAPEKFHTELALIYLRSALEQHKPGSAAGEHTPGAPSPPLRLSQCTTVALSMQLLSALAGRMHAPLSADLGRVSHPHE